MNLKLLETYEKFVYFREERRVTTIIFIDKISGPYELKDKEVGKRPKPWRESTRPTNRDKLTYAY